MAASDSVGIGVSGNIILRIVIWEPTAFNPVVKIAFPLQFHFFHEFRNQPWGPIGIDSFGQLEMVESPVSQGACFVVLRTQIDLSAIECVHSAAGGAVEELQDRFVNEGVRAFDRAFVS
jgi:hypothetical protein